MNIMKYLSFNDYNNKNKRKYKQLENSNEKKQKIENN